MVLKESTMLELGTRAIDFSLPDPQGTKFTLEQVKGIQGLLVMFICNHCPYVKHIQQALVAACNSYIRQAVGVVAINSNDIVSHPDDAPEKMAEFSQESGFAFPYLFDEDQSVAKLYSAACTPDFFLFDQELKLVYRGRFDESTPGNGKPVTGKDLQQAVGHLINHEQPLSQQFPSMGCNIKWKAGNAPDYFN